MRIVLAGATGAVGRPLVRRLLDAGHDVTGLTRSADRARELQRAGAQPVVCDLLDEHRLMEAVADARPEVVLDQTTDLPRRFRSTRGGMRKFYSGFQPLAERGKPALLRAAIAAGAGRYVMQSVAFLYEPGASPRRENDPVFADPPPPWDAVLPPLVAAEHEVTATGRLDGLVLRYGYFYGPGTHYDRDGQIHADVRRRPFPLVGASEGRFSFVHVDDAASAAVRAITAGGSGIYNVVDDQPAALSEWLPFYAQLTGAPRPMRVPRWMARTFSGPLVTHWATRQPGVSNEKAKQLLGWQPTWPSWRVGMEEALNHRRG